MTIKRNVRDCIQGLSCLGILCYVIYGDPTRLPVEWFGEIPRNLFTSAPAFMAFMALLYFIEGTKAAELDAKSWTDPVRRALDYYITYWKVCVPLVLVGFLFFSEHKESLLYCPMFENLSLLNISRAIVALTNNIHEGTWLVSSIAICAFSSSLYTLLCKKKGPLLAAMALLAGIALQCGLYLVVMPFMYHKAVFRVAPIIGSAFYAMGFLLAQRPGVSDLVPVRALYESGQNERFLALSRPVRFVGRNWVAFWMAQFYVTCYYFGIAASVHMTFGAGVLAYLVFAALTIGVIALIEWGRGQLIQLFKKYGWKAPILIVLTVAVPFLLRWVLEISMGSYAQFRSAARLQWPIYVMACVLAITCLMLVLRALTGRWLPAALILTVLLTLLSVANYYTMKYHGALLTVEDINNVQTAAGVIDSYDLSVDAVSGKILLAEAAAAACALLAWWIVRKHRERPTRRESWMRRGACLLAGAFGLYITYFAAMPIVEREDNIWSWGSLYAKIGYLSGTVESTMANLEFSVYEPEGYSDAQIARLKDDAADTRASRAVDAAAKPEYPDIVMILNESYYNLDMYIDTQADVDYMKNYNALDNAVKGYAEVPLTGGGTNGTEYEMLTGNSMSLVNAYAPFNRLNFTNSVSLPGYLKQLGYATIGAHPHESQNYHRGTSWAQMGIDKNYFIQDFSDLEYYASRTNDHRATDISVLKNVIRFMDDMPEDQPRFAFLATMQNHGGWEVNTPEQALVHSHPDTDSERLVNKINEFLSCILCTDDMIAFMQDYYTQLYEQTGRRVIVCMVGDHSPSFIPSLEKLCKWDDPAEADRRGKMTPYFIWANYPLDPDENILAGTEDMDLCCFMPTVLETAGLPLSYYYRHLSDMKKDVAVFTNVGSEAAEESHRIAFCDRAGAVHDIGEDTPLANRVRDYMYMEYNLSSGKTAVERTLFLPDAEAGERAED